ncbi:protein CutA homolog isoform X2 [Gopherus evgoodei]|uniref:protein CutA homolog isoform X2 n=1 Tax=Gopherus evgoodei TaxID=1825980 RepID=UPI0011D01CC6|nr:protein CutA homolog isoform X2 [Gopherus evgoodei]
MSVSAGPWGTQLPRMAGKETAGAASGKMNLWAKAASHLNTLRTPFNSPHAAEQRVITLSLLMYPVLKSLGLQLHSAVTGSYISGTHSIAFINCPNEQVAKDIARAIMDKKLAACVNILPKASSMYFWKGEIEEATEILLLVKTRTSKISELSDYISFQREETQLRDEQKRPTWQD